jgi:hypothetical protein
MKYIIYSCNIGNYDNFNIPKIYDKNVRYILFTDNKYFKSDVWEVNYVDFLSHLDDRKKARFLKLNPDKVLPKHEVNLWIDHNFTPKINNFEDFLNQVKFKNNIMLYKHRYRTCIYDEMMKVIEMKKESSKIADKQINKYKKEGFPKNFGLFETGFMIRPNNDTINMFNEMWWNEVNNESGRDQLSQMYVSWKTGIKPDPILIGKSAYDNKFLISNIHKKEYKA